MISALVIIHCLLLPVPTFLSDKMIYSVICRLCTATNSSVNAENQNYNSSYDDVIYFIMVNK